MSDDEPEIKAVHDLGVALRADGYSVGFDTSDYVEDFPDHALDAQDLMEADDLGGYFVVAHRDGTTDYDSGVAVNDPIAFGIVQIEMLGAHFRTVLDALPLSTTELVSAMIDEAITIDEVDDDE